MVLLEGGDKLSSQIENVLRRLHIPGTLHGMWYLAYAIRKTVDDPTYIRYITKSAYIDIAKHHNSTPTRVERAIRFAINVCWCSDGRKEFEQMTGHHLLKRPTNSEFIDLISFYIRHH